MRAGKHERRSVWVSADGCGGDGTMGTNGGGTLGTSSGRWRRVAAGGTSSKRWDKQQKVGTHDSTPCVTSPSQPTPSIPLSPREVHATSIDVCACFREVIGSLGGQDARVHMRGATAAATTAAIATAAAAAATAVAAATDEREPVMRVGEGGWEGEKGKRAQVSTPSLHP
jgi:hypothetical protein